jgi:hypothetical protein
MTRLLHPVLWLLLPLALLAGCVSPVPGPGAGSDAFELANLRPPNAIPRTSPARLVAGFEAACLDGPADPDRAAAMLRKADYVETRRRPGARTRGFVVDDSRPAVLLGVDGRSCAVAAKARTGQTERIRAMIARRYPRAQVLDPARIGPRSESAWSTGGGLIVLNRVVLPGRPSELLLIRLRSPGL